MNAPLEAKRVQYRLDSISLEVITVTKNDLLTNDIITSVQSRIELVGKFVNSNNTPIANRQFDKFVNIQSVKGYLIIGAYYEYDSVNESMNKVINN